MAQKAQDEQLRQQDHQVKQHHDSRLCMTADQCVHTQTNNEIDTLPLQKWALLQDTWQGKLEDCGNDGQERQHTTTRQGQADQGLV